ncbi:hypothetical protein K9M42_02450 [Patescibacteria group bacterium]|nr:hypothetical protein [Patescibacteria group bacterium]
MNKKIIIPTILTSLMITGILTVASASEIFGERKGFDPSFKPNNISEDCENISFSDWKANKQDRVTRMQEELDEITEEKWNQMKDLREAIRNGETEKIETLKTELGIEELDENFGMMRSMRGGRHRDIK